MDVSPVQISASAQDGCENKPGSENTLKGCQSNGNAVLSSNLIFGAALLVDGNSNHETASNQTIVFSNLKPASRAHVE